MGLNPWVEYRCRALVIVQGVEPHKPVAKGPRVFDNCSEQFDPDATTLELGDDEEPLHLADPFRQPAQAHATCPGIIGPGEEQAPPRSGVVSWEVCQFSFEALKAKIDADGLPVLEEEPTHGLDLSWAGRLEDCMCGGRSH